MKQFILQVLSTELSNEVLNTVIIRTTKSANLSFILMESKEILMLLFYKLILIFLVLVTLKLILCFRHFKLILTPRKEVINSKFKAYEVDGDGQEKSVHLGMNFYEFI